MTELPTGTVTILFTDIENSTQRWQQRPDDMRSSLAVHDELLGRVVVAHNGIIFKHTGDGIAAVLSQLSPLSERPSKYSVVCRLTGGQVTTD
jgi:class 3 adenylate cyclase